MHIYLKAWICLYILYIDKISWYFEYFYDNKLNYKTCSIMVDKPNQDSYDADDIKVLKGLEGVNSLQYFI